MCITIFNIPRLLIHQYRIHSNLFRISLMFFKRTSFGHLRIYTLFDHCFLTSLFIVIHELICFYFSNKFTFGTWSFLVCRNTLYSYSLILYPITTVNWCIIYILSFINFRESRITWEMVSGNDVWVCLDCVNLCRKDDLDSEWYGSLS